MKIAGKEIEWPKPVETIHVALFLAFLMSVVILKVLRSGLHEQDLLMALGVPSIAVVLFCMMNPEKAKRIVRNNHKTIYAVFMVLLTPLIAVVVIALAANAIRNCCNDYALMQGLGALAGIAFIFVLSMEIVFYKALLAKIKKAVRI